MATYLHMHKTMLWKENHKEIFQSGCGESLGGAEGGCQLK